VDAHAIFSIDARIVLSQQLAMDVGLGLSQTHAKRCRILHARRGAACAKVHLCGHWRSGFGFGHMRICDVVGRLIAAVVARLNNLGERIIP
jgi:hypothetical protein